MTGQIWRVFKKNIFQVETTHLTDLDQIEANIYISPQNNFTKPTVCCEWIFLCAGVTWLKKACCCNWTLILAAHCYQKVGYYEVQYEIFKYCLTVESVFCRSASSLDITELCTWSTGNSQSMCALFGMWCLCCRHYFTVSGSAVRLSHASVCVFRGFKKCCGKNFAMHHVNFWSLL